MIASVQQMMEAHENDRFATFEKIRRTRNEVMPARRSISRSIGRYRKRGGFREPSRGSRPQPRMKPKSF